MTEESDKPARRFCGLTSKEIISLLGSMLLPFSLGVFTVVITLYQQNVATQQRIEDRKVAREQREQDLNISREQRQHDLDMLALQRVLDLNISREQREQDKAIADDRLRDTILLNYFNDMAALLKENNGTLTANPVIATIARAKTLTVIQQLDSVRNTHLIKFLYEAKQLINGANPLDLSGADLSEVNFTNVKNYHQNIRSLSLAGALLRNSSFALVDLSNANFREADLTYAQFRKSNLTNADMSRSIIVRADFSGADLKNTNFDGTQSRRASFRETRATKASFVKGQMESVDFVLCNCEETNFQSAFLEKANFSSAFLHRSSFLHANLQRVNFTLARLVNTSLKNTQLESADFSRSICEGTMFKSAQLSAGRFFQTSLKDLSLTNLDMRDANFTAADLTLTSFYSTKLDRAIFNNAILVMSNFSLASLRNASITETQLSNALSVRGAILPNGTVVDRDLNLLTNGHADCNDNWLNNSWQIFPSDGIIIAKKDNLHDDCRFVNQINGSSSMSQRTNLTRYIPLISRQRAILVLKISGGGQIRSIQIEDHLNRLLISGNFTKSENQSFSISSNLLTLRVPIRTYEPQVTVEFFGYGWCDDIELFVELVPRNGG